MFTKSAAIYDIIYAFKDYERASDQLRALVRARFPEARTLLDVACGTGRHLEQLQDSYRVEGIDVNADLLRVAAERLPDVHLHEADMTDFDLGRRFDVVTCLFSSIAYVRTQSNMSRAIAQMARHLNPGGLLLVEPWFTPDTFWVGRLTANHASQDETKVSWMYVSDIKERISVLDIHYLVGSHSGVQCLRETHELGLFTIAEHEDAMTTARLKHEYDAVGFFGRGLHIGTAVVD
jgi:ubiquinone/menaquinone biosynthesis C-methylase UbiE